ncbi:MAG: ankyrin repeat domain-containing protein [Candidatus Babeliales bacterium]
MRRYLSIIILGLSVGLQAAEVKPKPYEVSEAEFAAGQTPNALLLHAVLNDDGTMFADALFRGASPNICRGQDKNSVLHYAAQHTTIPTFVEWLLAHKADVNERNAISQTPLMAAAAKGSGVITECLLKHKADPLLVDDHNNPALTNAVWFGNVFTLKHFMSDDLINRPYGEQNNTALIIASSRGYADIVSTLLTRKADPFIRNKDGKSALDCACEKAPKAKREEVLRYTLIAKELGNYTHYSREIYKATELKKYITRDPANIVASYLVYKEY